MSSDYPIEFVDLMKEYGQFIAVDGLNLQIKTLTLQRWV